METLIINVPANKSALIKEILTQFGISFKKSVVDAKKPSDYVGVISPEKAREMLADLNNR